MTTIAQIQSNKRNALQSTGPKTIEGKSRASHNALKHGVLSHDLIILDENRHELDGLACGIRETLCPQGAIEEILVEKIINAIWRCRRLTKTEGEIFSESVFSFTNTHLIHGFQGSNGDSLQVLSRYEATLERSFYRALHELQRIQGMRQGCHVLAPVSIDLTLDD